VDNLAPRNMRESRCTLDLSAGQPIPHVSLRHFFEAFGDELIDALPRLRGLFGDAAVKLRGDAQ
jgi:hypothetical protein